ncbi:NUDIX hydrolase [Flavipsychrobacter stenotrophus]|uniref:NUDIX hydrolase n=1 Tax=Flavipsychrobacter stenotrophus TaxID=2077091 RepID=A0A2S7SW58_9BACT|nr:NUDIX hydrolase [Flavipsychrobacter stenotrophus]PQJ10948.1 NUDIX hydrolase [Flavipsychrobacter stenotrophus]
MPYTYEYPRFAVTVDTVLLARENDQQHVLLIQRGNPPFENMWALPGGYVDLDETTADAAVRELAEETGVEGIALQRLDVFDKVDRHPTERNISVAYYALLNEKVDAKAHDDAKDVRWFNINELPDLAFDHHDIIQSAIGRL